MEIYNQQMFILTLISLIFFFFFINILIKDKMHKILTYSFVSGFTFYSAIGLSFYNVSDSWLHFFNYQLFTFLFIILGSFSSKIKITKKSLFNEPLNSIIDNFPKLLTIGSIIYIFSFVFPFLYPKIQLFSIFNISNLFNDYRVTPFSIRLSRMNDIFYTIVINQVRTLAMPFFYLKLYFVRRKPILFISLFLLPFYLKAISDTYLSRNNIAIILAFIFIYLIWEKFITKKLAAVILIISIPLLLSFFNIIFYTRQGLGFESNMTLFKNIYNLIMSETSFVNTYESANQLSPYISAFYFLLYLFLLPIPEQLTSFFGFTAPNLAYSLTTQITGLNYGDPGYYILLPSILGEGIIIFNKYISFFYVFIFGTLVFWLLRILKRNKYAKYLLLYFLLDFFRQLRGGGQFILSSWINTLLPFFVIILIIYSLMQQKLKRGEK